MQAVAVRLLQMDPDLCITFFMSGGIADKAAKDIERYNAASIRDRLRIIHLHRKPMVGAALMDHEAFVQSLGRYFESFKRAYKDLLLGVPVCDSVSGQRITAFQEKISVLYCDLALYHSRTMIRDTHSDLKIDAPLLVILCPVGSALSALFCSNEWIKMLEQVPDYLSPREARAQYIADNETVIKFPEHSPFYLYEADPNEATSFNLLRWKSGNPEILAWDTAVNVWPHCLGQGLKPICEHGFGKLFQIGPQLPDVNDTTVEEYVVEEHEGQVIQFLDDQLSKHGPQSVLYISFGSLEYPPSKESILILLDILDEQKVPYVMAKGCPPSDIAEILPSRIIASSGRGILCDWAPQVTILRHRSIFAFMSHGGSNSAMESLLCGVPLIFWPSCWDQPMIANEIDKRGAGIELLQVRIGHNIGKTTARGVFVSGTGEAIREEMRKVLASLGGQAGKTFRNKAKQLGDEMKRDVEPGGKSWADMRALLQLGLA
ncbi:hypothetical protein BCR39DRAFT_513376 [Naematelia encephala]|uniref:Uncharacterized protein n=1 Tax=Naematelia encephala TaxID=71784 RepID=A0A1Y2BIE3_9TREE|nr:hypothetical protein BCR39DRAFT_513376 [Naematelia encephala]